LEKAQEILERALLAAAEFQQFTQEQTDKIVDAVYSAALNSRINLARMATEETGIGRFEDKVWKNVIATQLVYENIRQEKTVGEISHNPASGITEIAQPLGPVMAITPVTNPTSTAIYKILICLKTRNPIIISAHRAAAKSTSEAARICYEAALAAGAPEYCIQMISAGSKESTQQIMAHKSIALILATGGTGMVHAAYSSGNPAIGVGPGNVPVFIDESADIPFAVSSIIRSKTFDNGTVCASEQAIVVEKSIEERVRAEFIKQECYFLNPEEIHLLGKVAVIGDPPGMSPFVIGQPVDVIARKAGLTVPEGTKILIAPLNGVGNEHPLSLEILAPILAFYSCRDYSSAVKTCMDLIYLGGLGHSAGIYAVDDKRIMEFSSLISAGRILVNTPTSQGALGGTYTMLNPSMTLGCGTGGKNITTENITVRHLINIQRVCRRKLNQNFFGIDPAKYLDENVSEPELKREYHKNQ
jgi:acetaldehyde dehydrogenase/alcohol dehydrogenase